MKPDILKKLAQAIKEGKFFHIFIINDDCFYLDSFHHAIVAEQFKKVKDAKVIFLGR